MNTFKQILEAVTGTLKRSEVESKLVEATWSHMLYINKRGELAFGKTRKEDGSWNINKGILFDPNMVSVKMGNDKFKFAAINLNGSFPSEAIVALCKNVFGMDASVSVSKSSGWTGVYCGKILVAAGSFGSVTLSVSNWSSLMLGQMIEAACKAAKISTDMLLPSAASWLFDRDGLGRINQIRFRYSTNGKGWFGGKSSLQRGGADTCGKLYESYRKTRLVVLNEKSFPKKDGDGMFVVKPREDYSWVEGNYDLVRGYFNIAGRPYSIVKARRLVSAENASHIADTIVDTEGYDGVTTSANLKGVNFEDLPVDSKGQSYVECFIATSKDEDKEKKSDGNKIGYTALSILDLAPESISWILAGLKKQTEKWFKKIANPESAIQLDLEATTEDGRILNSTFSKVALGIASVSEQALLLGKACNAIKSFKSDELKYAKVVFMSVWNGRKLANNEILMSEKMLEWYVVTKPHTAEDYNSAMAMRLPLASPQSAQQGWVNIEETNGLNGLIVVMHPDFAPGMSGDSDDGVVVCPNLVSKHVPGEAPIVTARAPKPEQVRDVTNVSNAELIILGEFNRMQTGIYANELFKMTSLIRESNLPENVKIAGIKFVCQEFGQNMELTIQGAKKPVSPEPVETVKARVMAKLVKHGLAKELKDDSGKVVGVSVVGDYRYGFIQTYKYAENTFSSLLENVCALHGYFPSLTYPEFPVRKFESFTTSSYLGKAVTEVLVGAESITNPALAKIWHAKLVRAVLADAFEVEINKEFYRTLDAFTDEEWNGVASKVAVALYSYAEVANHLVGKNSFAVQSMSGGALWTQVVFSKNYDLEGNSEEVVVEEETVAEAVTHSELPAGIKIGEVRSASIGNGRSAHMVVTDVFGGLIRYFWITPDGQEEVKEVPITMALQNSKLVKQLPVKEYAGNQYIVSKVGVFMTSGKRTTNKKILASCGLAPTV